MPAKRKPKGLLNGIAQNANFPDYSYRFSAETLAGLTAELGAGDVDHERLARALDRAATLVAMYPVAQAALDHRSRPSDRNNQLGEIERLALGLMERLANLDSWTQEDLAIELLSAEERSRYKRGTLLIQPVPLSAYKQSFARFVSACSAARKKYESSNSMGRPPKAALRMIVIQLRNTFAECQPGWSRDRPKRGAVDPLSEYERRERAFVTLTLDGAGIKDHRAIDEATYRRYFRSNLGRKSTDGVT